MTNAEKVLGDASWECIRMVVRASDFVIRHSFVIGYFVIRHLPRAPNTKKALTDEAIADITGHVRDGTEPAVEL